MSLLTTLKIMWLGRFRRLPSSCRDSNQDAPTSRDLPTRKLTWKPKKGPIKTTVPSKRGYMGFHVSLEECIARRYMLGFAGLRWIEASRVRHHRSTLTLIIQLSHSLNS